jgi:hypothetical protein
MDRPDAECLNPPSAPVAPVDAPPVGLDEIISILARGLARALELSRQPCPPNEGKPSPSR